MSKVCAERTDIQHELFPASGCDVPSEFRWSIAQSDMVGIARALVERLTDTLAFAA
jgi:methyl coenzyme M reductase subunit C-like uncharacterized protein (methanogenesis marker protein 7)